MSRSGYSDDGEYLELYRSSVDRSIKGRRGQFFLRELAQEMDKMPVKRLIKDALLDEQGEVCAIGVVCKARGIDIDQIDYFCPENVGKAVGISRALAAEIAYENDESVDWNSPANAPTETPEARWVRIRRWVEANLKH